MQKRAVIIGAGPAGLTAAYELLVRTDIVPIVIERNPTYVGGISRTESYLGNRIDIGGHRFFSKSDRVMRWWADMLPVSPEGTLATIAYQNSRRALTEGLRVAAESDGRNVMLVRPRKTRIVYGGQFFAYPIELSFDTVMKLGLVKMFKIGVTYLYAAIFPRKPEATLEDFFINRFGTELYETFFKSYTEKVWGTPCRQMSAEWGAQRVKGLSIMG
ncbi:MAG: NAD(P)-binding protein, partial [Patescibacteria group bacterium]